MKPPRKEILAVFVLAVLATGLSFLVVRDIGCPQIKCDPGELCPLYFCMNIYGHGWPLPYYAQYLPSITERSFPFHFLYLMIDFLFYFVLILVGWIVVKFVYKRVKS
ncbi:MAG: hypothetical protein A2Z24_02505 [Candidatus Woykebacteria bacterium RBG_16_44_10]|uniref:Uncharacterized protein n=1 Tax=Candidatus Woykebacteria bacterium RBG_16_44_10 TaxID=1802597 RepID=A0A1G1WE40_9BACT|nr:MAG: hypothetical protein A2Z24_02505 [Candidatus Woykebacteria bacterium RBG_16_44_10]